MNGTASAKWKSRTTSTTASKRTVWRKVSGTANLPVIFYPDMHYALAQIKKAAAIANGKIGAMPADVSKAIAQACDEMLTGKFNDQFPLDMWQGGGYTCVNMNVNEVIGNRANEILTGHKGTEKSSSEHSCQHGSVHQRHDSFCYSPRHDRPC